MDKVSVILTTYNSEKIIQKTINSILCQWGIDTHFEMELIVVDDCSTDNTVNILKKNKICYFTTTSQSGGPNRGRNIGLKMATGKYICFIDHDDIWDAKKTIKQLQVAQKFPVVTCGYFVRDNFLNKTFERKKNNEAPVIFQSNETFLNVLQRKYTGQNFLLSSLMIESELSNILFEENFGLLDFDWILRITEGKMTAELPECLVTRMVDSSNLSLNEDYRRKDFYHSLYTLENYSKTYPLEVKKGIKRINGSRARYYYLQNEMKTARKFFYKSEKNWKLLAYLLTSFGGSKIIKNKFIVFG